jgi:hypothetical protein
MCALVRIAPSRLRGPFDGDRPSMTAPRCPPGPPDSGSSDVEDDRHRTVVHELKLHPRTEDAGLDGYADLAKLLTETLVE